MTLFFGANMKIQTEPLLPAGEKHYVLITHDKTTPYANKGRNIILMENKKVY